MSSPTLDEYPGLQQRIEEFHVEQLVSELAVERLQVSALPRAPGLDEERLDLHVVQPFPDTVGRELRSVVRAEGGRHPSRDEQLGNPAGHALEIVEGTLVRLPERLGARPLEGLHVQRPRVRQAHHEGIDLPERPAPPHQSLADVYLRLARGLLPRDVHLPNPGA